MKPSETSRMGSSTLVQQAVTTRTTRINGQQDDSVGRMTSWTRIIKCIVGLRLAVPVTGQRD
jgi:hypothetical protein